MANGDDPPQRDPIKFPQTQDSASGCRAQVANPEDAERIAAAHVKKAGLYQGSFLGEGVLAQIHVDEWKAQRHHLIMGVLPMASLSQTFDLVCGSSADFGQQLSELQSAGERIEINELLCDKAFKLVGAALFGDEEHFAVHSEGIRWSYIWGLSGFTHVIYVHSAL